MYAIHQKGLELGRWNLVLGLVLVLLMAILFRSVAGAPAGPQGTQPRWLPTFEHELIAAVEAFRCGEANLAAERFERLARTLPPAARHEAEIQMWSILALQATDRFDEAMVRWQFVEMAPQAEVWKHLAVAVALLRQDQYEAAEVSLRRAVQVSMDNPIVHYYSALLHLEFAAQGNHWFDAVHPGWYRWAVFGRDQSLVIPNVHHEALAVVEFERTIALAALVEPEQPLIARMINPDPVVVPTVADLLVALHAENFELDAHHILAQLFIDRGQYEHAEEHLDMVAQRTNWLIFGYQEVAAGYESEGRLLDAAQAYAKAIHYGRGDAGAATQVLRNLGLAVRQGWRR